MPLFVLDVETMGTLRAASLRLSDEHGRHLGASQVRFDDHPASAWEGLFDLRSYVQRFAGVRWSEGSGQPLDAAALIEKMGVFLGEHVLGQSIVGPLASGIAERTLVVRLPDPSADPIAAALARVPWEIARPAREGGPREKSLLERNVVVRAALSGMRLSTGHVAIALSPEDMLRVLLVYAEAPLSRPLAARLERERLMELFASEVMPKRRVTVDVLSHYVTREELRRKIQDAGGYHIVHVSGHGQHDALELAAEAGDEGDAEGAEGGGIEGAREVLSGSDLVALFADAGGFIPHLVVLSACHSGSFLGVRDFVELRAWLRDMGGSGAIGGGGDRGGEISMDQIFGAKEGHTAAAFELLRAGVPQVLAMRYEVSDAYARELSLRFYRSLLGQQKSHGADVALAMAQRELASAKAPGGCHPVDHATPLLFGAAPLRFEPSARRSPGLDRLRPRPEPLLRGGLRDLDPPSIFVGRGAELSRLSSRWIAQRGAPIALIEGSTGIGKTALAAEAIHLFHPRFDVVVAYHTKGAPLALDDFHKHAAFQLARASSAYRERCRDNELAKVYIEPTDDLTGDARYEILRDNFVSVMLAERILLILDGFEGNLRDVPESASGSGEPSGFRPADPAWEPLFAALSARLSGSGSRVLITSRRPLAELASQAGERAPLRVPLGPLPPAEAALFFEVVEPLRRLLYGGQEEQDIASRILGASRGHPLILKRLAERAGEGMAALIEALGRIEALSTSGLPDAMSQASTHEEREAERRYFEDVASRALL